MILKLCKGVHCVDLGESFQTHIYLQNLVSIQPRTSPVKFAVGNYRELTTATADRLQKLGFTVPRGTEFHYVDCSAYI